MKTIIMTCLMLSLVLSVGTSCRTAQGTNIIIKDLINSEVFIDCGENEVEFDAGKKTDVKPDIELPSGWTPL